MGNESRARTVECAARRYVEDASNGIWGSIRSSDWGWDAATFTGGVEIGVSGLGFGDPKMGKSNVVASVRAARVATIGLLAGTLIISGASLAFAQGATSSGATAAATEGDASSTTSAPDTGAQKTSEAPLADGQPSYPPAPAHPSAPEQVSTPEQPAPQAEPAPAPAPVESAPQAQVETAPAEQPEQQLSEDAATQPEQRKAESVETPSLRWRTIDAAGAVVAGATVALQGPRDVAIEDLGGDEQWADAAATAVADNTGAADYAGLDLDPAPGIFRIEQFADEETAQTDPTTVPTPVTVGSDYRVRVAEADGYLVAGAAEWTALTVLTDATTEAQDVALIWLEPAARAQDEQRVTPMLVGPDGPGGAAATPPYVFWSVKSGSTLVGGASFNIQGPRNNSSIFASWSENSATIVDNGPEDLDKDNGEFLVKSFDGHDINSDRRYRIQQTDAPTGYRFTQSSNWVEISGNRQTPNANQWPGDVHDFGNFAVEALPSLTPICRAGYAYAISDSGQLQQIVGGTRTNIGTSLNSSNMNGLGIGAGGGSVYAIKRSGNDSNSQTATVYTFNTTTGIWSNTGDSRSTTVSLVAGAVNLSSGSYIFGGYSSNGAEFRLWQYNPGSGNFSYLGHIQTNMGSGSNNGDIAFNAAGDAFVVHGRGSNVTVFSITAANFNAANGGLIASAKSATISTNSSDVNGVAFDASGKSYLGNGSQLRSYDMPNWSNSQLVTSNLNDSTDLASCSSPATIKLQKIVQGGRAVPADQFRLELRQGTTTLGTATTAGTATGIQPQVVGPLPVVRGATLTFSETFVNGAVASDYATSYQCLVDGEPMSPAVTGTTASGAITIPAIGEAIVCEFVNTPLTASVSITKRVQDTAGHNEAAASGWTVDAAATATAGSVTRTPNAAQQTNGSGTASWPLSFATAASSATINVSETQQTGYEFVSGLCVITPSVGDEIEVEITGAAATALTGVKPGDRVACTYVNKQLPGSISWQKITDDDPAVHLGGSGWSVHGPTGPAVAVDDCVGASAADCAAALDKDERAGYLSMTGLAWGEYAVTEAVAPEGYELDATDHKVTITGANVVDGATIDPIVNVRTLGSVTWSKVDADTKDPLADSEWTLTGPGGSVSITDCIGADVAACAGTPDQDPAAGAFVLTDLDWADYSLVESAAPLGYVLDSTPHEFTVDKTTVDAVIALGAYENTLSVAPALPLTGGIGADFYLFFGFGVLLLALLLLATRLLWVRSQTAVRTR